MAYSTDSIYLIPITSVWFLSIPPTAISVIHYYNLFTKEILLVSKITVILPHFVSSASVILSLTMYILTLQYLVKLKN